MGTDEDGLWINDMSEKRRLPLEGSGKSRERRRHPGTRSGRHWYRRWIFVISLGGIGLLELHDAAAASLDTAKESKRGRHICPFSFGFARPTIAMTWISA